MHLFGHTNLICIHICVLDTYFRYLLVLEICDSTCQWICSLIHAIRFTFSLPSPLPSPLPSFLPFSPPLRIYIHEMKRLGQG